MKICRNCGTQNEDIAVFVILAVHGWNCLRKKSLLQMTRLKRRYAKKALNAERCGASLVSGL